MTDEVITDVVQLDLPYGRTANLKNVAYTGDEFAQDLNLLKLTLREGRRFTILDLDAEAARAFGQALVDWADGSTRASATLN